MKRTRRTAIVLAVIIALSCVALAVTQDEACRVKNNLRHCVD